MGMKLQLFMLQETLTNTSGCQGGKFMLQKSRIWAFQDEWKILTLIMFHRGIVGLWCLISVYLT